MYLTEEEAADKWCPQARMVSVEGENQPVNTTSFNRAMHIEKMLNLSLAGCRCIASECMMWRWMDDEEAKGFCGLAGNG